MNKISHHRNAFNNSESDTWITKKSKINISTGQVMNIYCNVLYHNTSIKVILEFYSVSHEKNYKNTFFQESSKNIFELLTNIYTIPLFHWPLHFFLPFQNHYSYLNFSCYEGKSVWPKCPWQPPLKTHSQS